MGTTLVICLLATYLHAASITKAISSSKTDMLDIKLSDVTTSPFVDVNEELTEIASSCMSSRGYEMLTGNVFKHNVVRGISRTLISESVKAIGLIELRAALQLPAPPPWQHLNLTDPSVDELASASTIESYYHLKEPRSKMRSLDSEFLFEHNVDTAIAYLDKHVPSIRSVFRKTFKAIRPSDAEGLDKKAIDCMIDEFVATCRSIHKATTQMLSFESDSKCWDARLDK